MMYSPALGACSWPSVAMVCLKPCRLKLVAPYRPRHQSANQLTFMHTTIVISKAGQLRWGTTLAAITGKATATAIFSISQNRNPVAAAIGFLALFVIPRASKAPGSTTANTPYSADQATALCCVKPQNRAAHNTPAMAWAATTRHGDTIGIRDFNSCA